MKRKRGISETCDLQVKLEFSGTDQIFGRGFKALQILLDVL